MSRTNEEKILLTKLLSGALDGQVGRDLVTSGGSRIWNSIKDGKIVQYKQGPGRKFFDGKENVRYPGVLHVLREWITEEDKLAFFQKFGYLMDDADAKAYSAKFKPKK